MHSQGVLYACVDGRLILQHLQQDVEDILNSTSPQPVMTVHKHGGKPLSEAIVGPHSPQTRPGYARKTPAEGGGYFTG